MQFKGVRMKSGPAAILVASLCLCGPARSQPGAAADNAVPRYAHVLVIVEENKSYEQVLDPLIDEALSKGWPLKRIETLLRAALRAGAYELIHRSDVPARVVVAEYADVAAAFVERDETGMVNAVLDQLARRLRADEFGRAAG